MIKLSNTNYEIIYTDPPWRQKRGGFRKSRPNQDRDLDYQTMSIEDIFEIQSDVLSNYVTKNHTVFMWAIDKFLPEIELNMKNLGYKLHARIIWNKLNGIAPAFTIRYSHEYLLWFYKDKMIPIATEQRGKWTTVLTEKSTKHSKKPEVAYEFIESLYPTQLKIEMYARNNRDGWDTWGNEI
ncbi:MAG: DNA methyltransferase [Gammaproteobacteria bacterium]|nr:DNA methyltransferase [Gammaproteobacteria bacterium]